MECLLCGGQTKVVNSRFQNKNNQIWRRRACINCAQIFTTHETAYLPGLLVVEKNGHLEPFEPAKLLDDLSCALKHRQDRYIAARELSLVVINKLRKGAAKKPAIDAKQIAETVAATLNQFDKRAAKRFSADYSYLED